jgi:hypothetical protein
MNDDDLYMDDEFDLDDFDDLDDLDLDDFDDPATVPSSAQADDRGYEPYKRVEQTFLQKYFYAVVAFVALSLFGLWFLGQNVSSNKVPRPQTSSAPQQVEQTQAEDQILNSDTDLPMPVPLNSFAEDNLPVYESREREVAMQNEDEMYDPGILTPLPQGVGKGYEDLGPSEGADVHVGRIEEPLDQILLPEGKGKRTDNADFDSLFTQNPGMTLSVKKSDLDGQKEPSVIDTVQNLLDGGQTEPDKDQQSPQMKAENLAAIKSELASVNQTLTHRIELTDTKIEDLLAAIKGLEQKIDTLDQTTNTARRRQTEPQPSVQKKTANTRKAQPRKVKKMEWQLRSAQTGKAVVALKGTNDFRTVEVGTHLSGIGKIKSIMLENGRWVVRGAHAKITQ